MISMSSEDAAMARQGKTGLRRSARFGNSKRDGEGSVNVLVSPMSAKRRLTR